MEMKLTYVPQGIGSRDRIWVSDVIIPLHLSAVLIGSVSLIIRRTLLQGTLTPLERN